MKKFLILLVIANLQFGCALRVYENGKLLVSDSSDSNGELTVKTKSTYVHFKGTRDNSTPTKTAFHGVHKIVADAITGAIGASVPGSTPATALIKSATTIAPQINAPKQ